jgi:PKHD-type hydroxylase
MLVCIPNVLDAGQLVSVRERLDRANSWVDGRVTASYQGAPVKFNQQIDERSEVAFACQRIIVSALERHPIFISAVLPNAIYPPMFNRYGEGMKFGAHVDGSVRISPYDGRKLRTDVSATLFLTTEGMTAANCRSRTPGGSTQSWRLATWWSGDQPAVHRSRARCGPPASSGAEPDRDDTQRCAHDMDNAIQPQQTNADEVARRSLIGCYHSRQAVGET